jgi:hypothetical protein
VLQKISRAHNSSVGGEGGSEVLYYIQYRDGERETVSADNLRPSTIPTDSYSDSRSSSSSNIEEKEHDQDGDSSGGERANSAISEDHMADTLPPVSLDPPHSYSSTPPPPSAASSLKPELDVELGEEVQKEEQAMAKVDCKLRLSIGDDGEFVPELYEGGW